MKRVIAVGISLVLLIAMAGCSSYTLLMSTEYSTNNSWTMSYQKFNGNKEKTVTFSGEGEHTFEVDISTEEGTLGLTITDKDGTEYFSGSDLGTDSFTVTVPAGEYTILWDADSHKGGFEVYWE